MGFLSKFTKKPPEERFQEEILEFEFGNRATNLFDKFSNFETSVISRIVKKLGKSKKLTGDFVGNHGWYLPNYNSVIDGIWDELRTKNSDLTILSKDLGLSQKRVLLLIEDYSKKLKLPQPAYVRKNNAIFLKSTLVASWLDELSGRELEDGLNFQELLSNVKIEKEFIDLLETVIRENYDHINSDLVIGGDGIIRLSGSVKSAVLGWINEKIEQDANRVDYSEVAHKYGLSSDVVAKTIIELIDEGDLNNIVNYPIEEYITPRV